MPTFDFVKPLLALELNVNKKKKKKSMAKRQLNFQPSGYLSKATII